MHFIPPQGYPFFTPEARTEVGHAGWMTINTLAEPAAHVIVFNHHYPHQARTIEGTEMKIACSSHTLASVVPFAKYLIRNSAY